MRKMIVGIVGLTLILINFSAFPQARAATITVSNNNDSGFGSLRQAITSALSTDIIVFASNLAGQTITLTTGEISIGTDLTIDGSSLNTPVSISGNGASRIFNIDAYNVTLDTLILKDGYVSGSSAEGGAIYNNGSLTLKRVTLTNNHTESSQSKGGAIYNNNILNIVECTFTGNRATSNWSHGGAIFNHGTLTVTDSTFSGNTAQSVNISEGGAIYNEGTLVVTDSTFSGNTAKDFGGGVYNNTGADATLLNCTMKEGHAVGGAGIYNDGTLTMTDCTIGENNIVEYAGGGLFNSNNGNATLINCTISGNSGTGTEGGAGIYNNFGTLSLTNCTISGNVTNVTGGGIYNYNGEITIINSTITNNIGNNNGDGNGRTGGIENESGTSGALHVRNTIIAGNIDNSPTDKFHDVWGIFDSQGYNLIGKSDGSTGFTNGVSNDIVGTIASPVSPGLGSLASNGGPTKTHALLLGSPVLDAIPESGTGYNGSPSTDQRGVGRPQPPGGNCDIGAFEAIITPKKNLKKLPSLLPLALNNLAKAGDLTGQAEDLLTQAKAKNLDTSTCEKLINEVNELLEKANKVKASPITANYYALKALEKVKQAVDCLKALLK